jgi:hypothetical protein
MKKTVNIDFNNSSSVILGYHPDILTGSASTGFAWSTHIHGNVSLALTNITGSYTSVSNGLTFALEAGSVGGGTVHAGDNITLGTAVGHTTVSAYGLASATHDHGGAPSITGVIGGTISSNAWSISIPDFLLTAAESDHSHAYNSATSTGHIAGEHISLSNNTAGITMGIPAFLTAAAGVSHVHGSFLGTNITQVSSGSGGLALSVSPKLGTNTSSNTVTGSTFYMAGNSSGLTLSMPNFLTTAPSFGSLILSDSNNIVFGQAVAGSTTTVTASAVVSNLAGISHNHGAFTTLVTAGTGVLYSSSTNGFTLGMPAYVTSQSWDASVYDFDGFSSASIHASGIPYGLSLTASPGNVMTIDGNKTSSGATGYSIISNGTVTFAGGDNITLIQNGNIISIQGEAGKTDAGVAFSMSASNTSGTASLIAAGTLYMQGGDNITLFQNSNTINFVGAAAGIVGVSNSETMYTSGSVILSDYANITISSSVDGTKQYYRFSVADPAVAANSVYSVAGGFVYLSIDGISTTVSVTGLQPTVNMSDYIAISGNAIRGIIVSDTTYNSGSVSFLNSNNVSFGSSGEGIITISHALFPSANTTKFAGTGTTITGGSVTLDSVGLELDIPQGSLYYVDGGGISFGAASSGLSTTITATIYGGGGTGGVQIAGSAASTVATGLVQFANANGISFGLSSDTMTANWNSGDYIGTAYLGYWQATEVDKGLIGTTYTQHTHGTGISWGNTTHTSETVMRASSSSNGLTIVVPPYITTAGAHTHGGTVSTATYTTGGTAATSVLFSSASNGLTMSYPAYAVTSHTHSNLYAGAAHSHGAVSTYATNGSTLLFSSASSGLSLSMPAWITTAAVPLHSHGNPTLSLSNLSGATASASNGLTISLTGYPATSFVNVSQSSILYFQDSNSITWGSLVAGSTTTIVAGFSGDLAANMSITAGSLSVTRDALSFANTNGVSFGMSGSTITGSVSNNVGNMYFTDGSGVTFGILTSGSSTTVSGSVATGSVYFVSNSGNITWSSASNGASTSIYGAAPVYPTISQFQHPDCKEAEVMFIDMLTTGYPQGALLIKSLDCPYYVSGSAMRIMADVAAGSFSSNTTASGTISLNFGIWQNSQSSLTLLSSSSMSYNFYWLNTNSSTYNNAYMVGVRELTMPINIRLTPGHYYFGFNLVTASAYTTFVILPHGNDDYPYGVGLAYHKPFAASGPYKFIDNLQGSYTATTNGIPNVIASSQLKNWVSSDTPPMGYELWNQIYNI